MGNELTGAELDARIMETFRTLSPENKKEAIEFAYALRDDPIKADQMMQAIKERIKAQKGVQS